MLKHKAVLLIEDQNDYVGAFDMRQVDIRPDLEKEMLFGGNRGQLLDEFGDFLGIGNSDAAVGYTLDAGLGTDSWTVVATIGPGEDTVWGEVDPSSLDPVVDPDKPSAHDGDPRRRAEVLHDWVRVTRADSIRGRAELHAGGWHDDSFAASAGLFGGPIRVTPTGMDFDDSHDDPSAVTVTLTLSRTDPFPDVDSIIPEN